MSVSTVTARIAQIESTLALLDPNARFLAPGQYSATATQFSQQLAAAAATGSAAAAPAFVAGAHRIDGPVAATAPGGDSRGTVTGDAVVAEARRYLGIPYKWGGTDPAVGLDCSGLVQLVYKNLGIDLPRVSYQQATAGTPVKGGLANAKPGDILAFNSPVSHVGIYIGDGKMLHAPRTGTNVRIEAVYDTPTAIRRVIPETTTTQVGAGAATSVGVPGNTPYANLFTQAAAKHGVDARLLVAVARAESAFNPRAVSHAGAQGLMQLMPATARSLGVTDSFNPSQAIDGAAKLLAQLKQQFGRTDLALAAYNAGPGAVNKYGGIPPYTETRSYVAKIMTELRGNR